MFRTSRLVRSSFPRYESGPAGEAVDRDPLQVRVVRRLDPPVGRRSVEEGLRMRTRRIGEEDLRAERGQKVEQTIGVAALVEDVRGEDEAPRRLAHDRLGLVPVDDLGSKAEAVSLRVLAQEPDRVG